LPNKYWMLCVCVCVRERGRETALIWQRIGCSVYVCERERGGERESVDLAKLLDVVCMCTCVCVRE